MNTVNQYTQLFDEKTARNNSIIKEITYLSNVYKALNTANETPDIPLLDYLNNAFPDWTQVLERKLVISLILYSSAMTDEQKKEINHTIAIQKTKLTNEFQKNNIDLSDCQFEIDEKIAECDIKIEELQSQAKAITKRIGIIEAEKHKWLELKKKL